MPRTASSNGIPPEYRILSILTFRKPVTPKEISDFVGTSERYASKYISLLKRDGFVFTRLKSGTKVLSYTLVQEPLNSEIYRNMTRKQKVTQAKPQAMPQAMPQAKPSKARKQKQKLKKVAPRFERIERRPRDHVENLFGSTGEIASSYSVDADWDSTEQHEIRSLIRDYM